MGLGGDWGGGGGGGFEGVWTAVIETVDSLSQADAPPRKGIFHVFFLKKCGIQKGEKNKKIYVRMRYL
jgi:hypothetical protein